jgi:four helix bundle protein
MFDHEKLAVYQVQLQVVEWVGLLLDEVQSVGTKSREVRDQIDRASLSVLLNIAEGNGKRRRQTRAKSLDDARGSCSESAACLDALVAKRICTGDRVLPGKQLVERVFAMLTKLIQRYDNES